VYRHTQVGWPGIVIVGGLLIFFGSLLPTVGLHPILVVILVLLTVLLVTFTTLTVEVGGGLLALRFGPGPIGRRFPLSEIRAAHAVRNRWWYGWGIRLTPHGWLFNVSGLDAVEIELASGKTYRIGTDEPERLAAVILESS